MSWSFSKYFNMNKRSHCSHLEHNQVVIMPLYLEDVGESCHSCFKIWRITCKGKNEKKKLSEKAKYRDKPTRIDASLPYCQGWWEDPLLWHCRRLPAAHTSCISPLKRKYSWVHFLATSRDNSTVSLLSPTRIATKVGWWGGTVQTHYSLYKVSIYWSSSVLQHTPAAHLLHVYSHVSQQALDAEF